MQTLRRLFGILVVYWKTLLLSIFLLSAHAGAGLVPPLLEKRIIDAIVANSDYTDRGLVMLGGSLLAVYACARIAGAADGYVRHVLGERFILDLRVRLYAYLQRLSLAFFERTSTGELMSRVTNDINALEQFVTHGLAMIVVDLFHLLGAVVILLQLNERLALLVFAPVPVLAISLRYYNTRIRPIYRRVRDRLGDINARLQDSLSGMQVVQAFGQERRELERFTVDSENYFRAQVQGIRYWSTFFPMVHFVFSIGRVLVLGVGAWMALRGELTLGTLVAFLSYMHMLYGPVQRLVEIDNIFQQAIAAGDRIFELFDEQPEIQDAPDATELPPIRGDVVFDAVQFFYGTGDVVLHEVSFHMRPGEVVALVGPSGAGKTSIANLLCRFYDPIHGKITVDGYDLRQIELASLRRQIAVVLQDTFLFNTTIRENLLYGKPDATEEELVSAAKAAYAHDFITSLPNGYDTEVGERGVRLSGGQKQRLALARAILADPKILILDEATSSVDAEAEFLIQQALTSVLKERTALVIAHRLSTVRDADKIIALEEGRIIEIGHHNELMQRDGLYSQLYRRQLELTNLGA